MSYLSCVTNAAFAAKRNSVLANLSVNSTSLDVDMGDNKKCDICELGATNADAEVGSGTFLRCQVLKYILRKEFPKPDCSQTPWSLRSFGISGSRLDSHTR